MKCGSVRNRLIRAAVHCTVHYICTCALTFSKQRDLGLDLGSDDLIPAQHSREEMR